MLWINQSIHYFLVPFPVCPERISDRTPINQVLGVELHLVLIGSWLHVWVNCAVSHEMLSRLLLLESSFCGVVLRVSCPRRTVSARACDTAAAYVVVGGLVNEREVASVAAPMAASTTEEGLLGEEPHDVGRVVGQSFKFLWRRVP